jgi:hypothetical protein
MTGLEKQKAKSGDVSQSARALTVDDMHKLYYHLVARPGLTTAQRRQGIVRYVSLTFFRLYSSLNLILGRLSLRLDVNATDR